MRAPSAIRLTSLFPPIEKVNKTKSKIGKWKIIIENRENIDKRLSVSEVLVHEAIWRVFLVLLSWEPLATGRKPSRKTKSSIICELEFFLNWASSWNYVQEHDANNEAKENVRKCLDYARISADGWHGRCHGPWSRGSAKKRFDQNVHVLRTWLGVGGVDCHS